MTDSEIRRFCSSREVSDEDVGNTEDQDSGAYHRTLSITMASGTDIEFWNYRKRGSVYLQRIRHWGSVTETGVLQVVASVTYLWHSNGRIEKDPTDGREKRISREETQDVVMTISPHHWVNVRGQHGPWLSEETSYVEFDHDS